ncbi:MAG: tatB [Rhodospirillaceae bacterium]|nr:MAG: tatB [Rhodospirillaceae bacterium]
MFDFSMSELLVVAVVALVAIGPKDLPRALHTLGRWVGKVRTLAGEFHRHMDEIVREAELEEFRRKAEEFHRKNLAQVLENTVDPDGEIRRGLELPLDHPAASSGAAADHGPGEDTGGKKEKTSATSVTSRVSLPVP